jgi:preprotein translocase subunit SecA
VTIATNMAGRGTDIQLGGNPDSRLERAKASGAALSSEDRERLLAEHSAEKAAVVASGGLLVIGTERHHSRRIDNQLRGRSGRQGDPGQTMFILSIEDDIVRNLDPEWLQKTLSNRKLEEGALFGKVVDAAQSRAESRLSSLRMQLLRFDNVVNEQRKTIYALRREWMETADLSDIIRDLRDQYIQDLVNVHLPVGHFAEMWDTEGLAEACRSSLNLDLPVAEWAREQPIDAVQITARIVRAANSAMDRKVEILGAELMRSIEKQNLLETIDAKWGEHRILLDQARSVVGLRAYGRRDPFLEFQTEALEQFENLLAAIRREVSTSLAHIEGMTGDEQLSAMSSLAAESRKPV